jgi:hypothetical protein
MAIIAAVSTAASAGAAAYASHEQGVAASNQAKQKARVEADKETQNQINMRQNMLKALASQNAAAGVGGVGVNKAGAMRQINQAQNDIMVSRANSSAQVSLLDQQAANDRAAGNIGAVGDLAKGAATLAGQ